MRLSLKFQSASVATRLMSSFSMCNKQVQRRKIGSNIMYSLSISRNEILFIASWQIVENSSHYKFQAHLFQCIQST